MAERRDCVDARRFPTGLLSELFQEATRMKSDVSERRFPAETDKKAYLLFYAPSDHTTSSFDQATSHLHWRPTFFNLLPTQTTWGDHSEERLIKEAGYQGYAAMILRSQVVGGAEKATSYAELPVISAGEGFNLVNGQEPANRLRLLHFPQHPTQALGEGFTVFEKFDTIDSLRFVITGDIRNNPVVNSWLCIFANFPNSEITLATERFSDSLHQNIEAYLEQKNVRVTRVPNIDEVLSRTDVLCIAHSQNVRRNDLPMTEIGSERLEALPTHAIIMHDLIKGDLPEDAEVTKDPRLVHRQQIANGVLARMAVLNWVTGS